MKAVIDTNVLRVASDQHAEVSPDCVEGCVRRLLAVKKSGVAVIDDGYRIMGEYLRNPSLMKTNEVGGQFLKWLLQNQSNPVHVEQVPLTETAEDCFTEFPDSALESAFDAPDRKFVAVAHAHPERPPVWQAADCKWLDWWQALSARGVRVEFLCPTDACRFYARKFPKSPIPALPGA
jgi:hypothetical protein